MSPLIINGKTEKELIKAALGGDRKSQKDIFHLYASKMLAVSYRYAKDKAEAEDILQDAFIKVFINLQDFEFKGSFEGWIRKIVINTAIKFNLKRYHAYEEKKMEQIQEDWENPEVFSNLAEIDLLHLIQELPDGYKMVFNLYAIEGYSHKEIAEMCYIEESTSRSQLAKARKILQQKVKGLLFLAV